MLLQKIWGWLTLKDYDAAKDAAEGASLDEKELAALSQSADKATRHLKKSALAP